MWRVAGVMSGTSLDGVDVCLARFWLEGDRPRFHLEGFATYPFPDNLKAALLAQLNPETSRIDRLAELDGWLGEWFAESVLRLLSELGVSPDDVDLVGSHGQTIWHAPHGPHPATLQLGDGSVIAVRTGITTVSDFRPADVAAGGQGAPLVPFADRVLFSEPDRPVALLNLGGIANVTWLAPGGTSLMAFDTGPANMVVDRFVERMSRGHATFDRDGALARAGSVHPDLLGAWLSHPYFSRLPPKSTGREEFGHAQSDAWYDAAIARGLDPQDLVATATALTARSIARALTDFCPPDSRPTEVIASGGGASNPELMRQLAEAIAPIPLVPLESRGVSSDAKEALAFALFAYLAARGLGNHAPEATGAREPLILGKMAPGRNFGGIRRRGPAPLPGSVTEAPNPRSRGLDAMGIAEVVDLMIDEEERVQAALMPARGLLAALIERVVEALRAGGRLFYVGAGTSGRLGVLDASECPPTFSSDPDQVQGLIAGGDHALRWAVEGAEDDRSAGERDLKERGLTAGDVVVGLAASGRTPYVHGALEFAHRLGAATGLLVCNPLGEAPPYVEHLVELVVGPEVLTGSTRLKAGTVTKVALNAITTATMVALGKAYDNRMVDVRASNQKLQERARRMVETLAGVDPDEAERLLAEAGGRVKTAVVMAHRKVSAREADRSLAEAQGHLRAVIGPWETDVATRRSQARKGSDRPAT